MFYKYNIYGKNIKIEGIRLESNLEPVRYELDYSTF